MSKKCYLLNCITLFIFILCCIFSVNKTESNSLIPSLTFNDETPKVLPVARIIIPKIGLDNPLYDIDSDENTVEKNIMFLNNPIFPNNDSSIIFLAAHSGSGGIAYFNDLDRLSIEDTLILQYKNYNYYYIIDKIYEVEKDGDIEVNKSSDKQLVLTTCSKTNQKKQLIINSNLEKTEEIT